MHFAPRAPLCCPRFVLQLVQMCGRATLYDDMQNPAHAAVDIPFEKGISLPVAD